MKSCGGCRHFQRMKTMVGNSGICELHDRRTDEDCGHRCDDFKAKRYERPRKQQLMADIAWELDETDGGDME